MRTTQRKGDYAVTRAIASFTKAGLDVSLPITESASYDIVVDDNGKLKKVQVRYFSGRLVELRRIHSNSKGYVIKKTKKNAYDWLYALSDTNKEYLIKECFENRRSVTPQPSHLFNL
ncbi:MAG: group I intron-associated PD-(D/E)XK endonuclease [Candidatus Saccharibacteria bacterium]|nr:group I intron-associated PD-(D/E)XK endonuclease [Candidatus Saccharibacteria bacterium]